MPATTTAAAAGHDEDRAPPADDADAERERVRRNVRYLGGRA
jgi:hypothetical protein